MTGTRIATELRLDGYHVTSAGVVAGVPLLRSFGLDDNDISILEPFAGLVNLQSIHLENNSTTDLSPLTADSGMGQSDRICLLGNPVDCTEQAAYIADLKSRGVSVTSDCN